MKKISEVEREILESGPKISLKQGLSSKIQLDCYAEFIFPKSRLVRRVYRKVKIYRFDNKRLF